MDCDHRFGHFPFFERLSRRVRGLPAIRRKILLPLPGVSRRSKGALLVTASLALALAAHRASEQTAQANFEQKNGPGTELFSQAMKAWGYAPARGDAAVTQALRQLPPGLEGSGTTWISDDLHWVAFHPVAQAETLIFCAECSKRPGGWNPGGRGWQGFQEAMRAIGQLDRRSPAPEKKKRKAAISKPDPREIRY